MPQTFLTLSHSLTMYVLILSQAKAGMLQLRPSLSRQSKPSTRTAGLLPKLDLTHPLRAEEEADGAIPDEGIGTGTTLSSPKRASWISGLDTLLGGDPEKNGGDEATCRADWSELEPPCSSLYIIRLEHSLDLTIYLSIDYWVMC